MARICAAGHGGQMLVSASAYQALTAAKPEGVTFRLLGTHRFRGLPEPIKIYQVEADGLAAKFPPLRVDVDPARMAEAEVPGWEEAWSRSKAVGH
jgi:class 3 adenylate cyclase